MILYIALAVIALCVWILTKQRNRSRIPGPPGLPFLGNSMDLNPDTFHFQLEKWAKQYGPIFRCSAMGIDILVLSKPELVRKAFCSEETGMILSDRAPSFLGKYIFRGYKVIAVARLEPRTFKLRKVFHNALRIYGDGVKAFEEAVHCEIERLVVKLTAIEGEEFDPRPVIERSLGNLMTILLCGEPMSERDEEIIYNVINAVNQCTIPTYEFCMYNLPWLRFTPGYFGNTYRHTMRCLDEFVARYYTPYKATYKPGTTRGLVDAFIRLQAENTAADGTTWLTDEQVDGLIQITIIAGLVTTTNTLVAAILLLLKQPECLEKAYNEVMEVVGGDRLPQLTDKVNMPYTEAMILECQRVSNLISVGVPHNCSADIVLEGYEIKKDTRVMVNLWGINQDPDVWEEPDKFRPERFLDTDGKLLPPEHKIRQQFLLFSAGRRKCPGVVFTRSRMFLYVSSIIQKFELLPPASEPLPSSDPATFTAGTILVPPAYKIRAVRRQ